MNDERHWYQVPHKFKAKEWTCTMQELVGAIATYGFQYGNPTPSIHDNFFQVFNWVIAGSPTHIHCETIAEIVDLLYNKRLALWPDYKPEAKTEEEIREVFDKYLDDFGHVGTEDIEPALLWYYGIYGYTKKDVQTGKSIAPNMIKMDWFTRHRFKGHEWMCTKDELIRELADYHNKYVSPEGKRDWEPHDIIEFLEKNFHLPGKKYERKCRVRPWIDECGNQKSKIIEYKGCGPIYLHHIRCVWTLIKRGAVKRCSMRL